MSFDNDEAGVGEPLSHEQKVVLHSQGKDYTLTDKQRALNRIAEKLGVKLVWDIDGDPALFGNGYYENGVIHMNKQAKAKATVFAHEYIHYIEQSKLWPAFKKFIEGTQAYKSWITLRGNNSDVEQATKNYKARLETNYKKAGKKIADSDIIANFMAERFFGGDFEGDVEAEAEADAESLLREFAKNDKWYHNIIRFARQMISHFKGDKIQEEFYKMERILLKARKEVQKNPPTNTGGRKYSLNTNAKSELHKALYDTNYRSEVLLRDNTPDIMLSQKGVKNLPMAMQASHIRENIFTEAEAKQIGLKVDEHTHYHGLGEVFFLKIIDGLDNVKEAYRGTKYASNPQRRENYFLLISEFKDGNGNVINVPVYINEHSQYNRVFIDTNKIATVFGRDDFRKYIANQVKNKNLVKIKNRSNKSSEGDALIAPAYRNTAPKDIISNSAEKSNKNSKKISKSHSVTPATEAKKYF